MNETVRRVVKETNWNMVSVVGGAMLSGIVAFASIKSDIRDISTLLTEYRASAEQTDAKVTYLTNLFIENSFNALGMPNK